jgi:Domain of unknown function (DUF4351)
VYIKLVVPIELADSSACAKGDRIRALSVEQVEALGEVLLNFYGVNDLVTWLGNG